jgi:hypothetical protein
MKHVCQPLVPRVMPEWANEPATAPRTPHDSAAGPDEPVVASLGCIDLARGFRRELGIRMRDRTALAVTDRELLVLTRRGARTTVAARYPRHAAQVIDFRTLPPGGDFLVDRLVISAGDVAIRADFDGRLHRDAESVVAALGGVAPAG